VSANDQTAVHVLVVDDSEVFRNVLCAVVAATPGFEVVGVVSSGRETLTVIGSLAVDLVLVDVKLPDLDGIETGLRIRRRHPNVVVVVLTAATHAYGRDSSPMVEDKRDLSPERLDELWRQRSLKPLER